MRIDKMITKGKCSDSFSNSPDEFSKQMYRDQFGEFVCRYWGLILASSKENPRIQIPFASPFKG